MCFAVVGKSVGSKWNFYESSSNRLDLTFHRDIMYSTLYVYRSAYYAGTIYDWFDDSNARLGFSIVIMYFSLQKSARQNPHNEFCAMFEEEKKNRKEEKEFLFYDVITMIHPFRTQHPLQLPTQNSRNFLGIPHYFALTSYIFLGIVKVPVIH